MDILKLIRSNQIFSSLDKDALKVWLKKFDKVYLNKDEILFEQGECPDCIYLLAIGLVSIHLKKESQEETLLGFINPGETIGELSTISNQPRPVTIKAQENSILLKISNSDFQELCLSFPYVSLATIRAIEKRSNKFIQAFSKTPSIRKQVAILPAYPMDLEKFSNQLALHTEELNRVIFFSEYNSEFTNQYRNAFDLEKKIEAVEDSSETVLYFLKSIDSLLASACFKRANAIYIIAKPSLEFEIQPNIKKIIKKNKLVPELILLWEEVTHPSPPLLKWLNHMDFALHHHIRSYETKDYQRILRFMRGRALGVVLGGGGLRSWAHLGALEAIIEAGLPIDIIGGTSAGAVVAAHFLMHGISKQAQKSLRELSELARKIISIKNLTWPTLSLFNTKKYMDKQKSLFDHIKIEDLPLPCFFVSCNLSKNVQVIHRKGSLCEAITSTTAVPAIFPPVVVKGDLQVDGGILNNLPVDIMKRSIGPNGIVVAVELTHYDQDTEKYNFPANMTLWETIKYKLGLSSGYKYPSFLDIFLKSLLAGSTFKQEENSAAADILVKPNLSKFGLMSVSKKQEDQLIALGKTSTKKAIKEWQRKLKLHAR